MARIPEKDMQALISDLGAGRKTVRKPKVARKAQTGYLIAAALVIVGGAAYSIVLSLTPAAVQESAADDAGPKSDSEGRPAQQISTSTVVDGGGGAPSAPGTHQKPSYVSNLRPANVVDRLPLPAASFILAEDLPAPSKNKPLVLYVLLYSILDSYTEQLWIQRGLLRDEGPLLSPFIRKVKLVDVEDLSYLTDWHVESAAVIEPKGQ